MARQDPLNDQQSRLLKITARMPLASVANLAPALDLDEEKVRGMLGALRRGDWVTSVVRGMTERRQHRWFLTRRAVHLLYVTDHQHPAPREEARAVGQAAFHPEGELPEDYRERFALDHDHPAHLEGQGDSPFVTGDTADHTGDGPDHEHPPWTATSRGIETSLRRLAMLESVYRLAPDLVRSGRVNLPAGDTAASREARMTDFRLLRRGGFYHAVARYGPDLWTLPSPTPVSTPPNGRCGARSSTASGVWTPTPTRRTGISALVTVCSTKTRTRRWSRRASSLAHDAWARELARNTLSSSTPTLFCTPDGSPGPRRFEPPAGPCREYRCRQILRETKSNHRQE